jgi:hypothetical protein
MVVIPVNYQMVVSLLDEIYGMVETRSLILSLPEFSDLPRQLDSSMVVVRLLGQWWWLAGWEVLYRSVVVGGGWAVWWPRPLSPTLINSNPQIDPSLPA